MKYYIHFHYCREVLRRLICCRSDLCLLKRDDKVVIAISILIFVCCRALCSKRKSHDLLQVIFILLFLVYCCKGEITCLGIQLTWCEHGLISLDSSLFNISDSRPSTF